VSGKILLVLGAGIAFAMIVGLAGMFLWNALAPAVQR
jgi:hypothetical protein